MSRYYYKKYETRDVFDVSVSATYNRSYWSDSTSVTAWDTAKEMYYIGTPSGYSASSKDSMAEMLKAYAVITEDGFTVPQGVRLAAGLTLTADSYIIVVSNMLETYGQASVYLQRVAQETTLSGESMQISTYARISATHKTLTDGAGAYIGEVIAEDGEYPDNGKSTDGYWYIKDRLAVEFKARINGAWIATEPYVRVNGTWIRADIHPRVNGAWVG